MLRAVVRLVLLLGLLQLGTAIKVDPQPQPLECLQPLEVPATVEALDPSPFELYEQGRISALEMLGMTPFRYTCPQGYVLTDSSRCRLEKPVCCPQGYTPTAKGACVKPLDPCEQCDSLFKECEGRVSQGVDKCKTAARQFATDICSNHLNKCTGNPISIWLDEDPPIICQGELTVSDIGWIYCDGKRVGHRGSSWIHCRAPFEPGKAWTELPRCINAKIDDCIETCLLSNAGTGATLSGSIFFGFSAGVSYTIPPNTGYNAGCIALGIQAYYECASEKQKCQEACRPSGPSTITPGPRR